MEYKLKAPVPKKNRWTIGFLDENLNNDFYTQMWHGAFEAARKLQVDIIRFAYYPKHLVYKNEQQVRMILDLTEQFSLDGLLFLGWCSAGPLHNREFTARFPSIPLVSIGTLFEDIPYVYFPGNKYIREIVLHLIKDHHYKRIAYIAPIVPDDRNQTYLELMRDYGIYHPELYVSEGELGDTAFTERGGRALAILLDERRTSFDAIMTTCSEETGSLLTELNRRGLRVPQDVAVTTYEDQNTAKYSSPGLTTVYYPAEELGFCGCAKLVELLTHGRIAQRTEIPGKVIYRNSCGCMSSSIKMAAVRTADSGGTAGGVIEGPGGGLDGVNGVNGADPSSSETLTEVDQKKIVAGMKEAFPYGEFDFQLLLDAFYHDLKTTTGNAFISELATQLSQNTHTFIQSNVRDLTSVFRNLLLPYLLKDQANLLGAGNLFQQGQVMTWEKTTNVISSLKVNARTSYQVFQEISQTFATSFNMEDMMNRLAKSLPLLQIPGCYIFMFHGAGDPDPVPAGLFEHCQMVFAYSNHERHMTGACVSANLPSLLTEIVTGREPTISFLVHLLHVTDDIMGFILFEPGPRDQMLYQTLANQISIALRGAGLLEKLLASYQKLAEHAHWKGVAEISSETLHNIGNILTSINIAVSVLKSATDSMLIPHLIEANAMLSANLADLENFIAVNPKGKKLLRFYLKLGISFGEFKKQAVYHVNRLENKVQSIVNLISAQQAYAGVQEVVEKVDIAAVIDDTLKLMTESIDKYQIKITKNYLSQPRILAPKIKLFQVLVQLINRAGEAMVETPMDDRRLIFTISEDEDGNYIRIWHNGSGTPGNLLEKIFEYGYSDPSGHQLGLQSGKKYITVLGGKISTESDGLGRGTRFILWFR